ncbi:MAG: acetyltransferase [Clostridiaceae bacterium]
MKDIIIFGNADFARLMHWYIEHDTNRKVVSFCVDQAYLESDIFCGLPVVDFETIQEKYSPEKYEILIAIGNNKMNDVRKKFFFQCKEKGYKVASYFHSSAIIESDDIGEGNIILEGTLIQPFSKIGNGNLLWDYITIAHDDSIGDFNTISGGVGLCGYVKIGNNCYLGKHSMIYDHVKIEDYTLVGAGAYVRRDTKSYSVIVPARSVLLENKKSTDFM